MSNTLKYFDRQIKKCSDFVNEDYYHTRVDLVKGEDLEFSSYINGFNWVKGKTMSECIVKTQESVGIKNVSLNFSIPLDL